MNINPLLCFKDWLAEQDPSLKLEMPEPYKLKMKRNGQYLGMVYVGYGGDWLVPDFYKSWPPSHTFKDLQIANPNLFPLLLSYIKGKYEKQEEAHQ